MCLGSASSEFLKKRGPVLLFKTISKQRNCFTLSVVTDVKDGHGFTTEKVAQMFLSFNAMPEKITKIIVSGHW